MRRGRFAPSPTGPLHAGSLATALASWLDAQIHGYDWLVRIEDLDPPREVPGAAREILSQLAAHGLHHRGDVLFQSTRHQAYEDALEQLIRTGQAYACSCSRKTLQEAAEKGLARRNADGEIIYPGFCRHQSPNAQRPSARREPAGLSWRFKSPDEDDVVIRRADGLWAYHLAVVVDDAAQGITDIVRGDDLLLAEPRHAALRQALGCAQPRVLHVPVVRHEHGEKLSKQTQAPAIATSPTEKVFQQLTDAWAHLSAHMPADWAQRAEPLALGLAAQYRRHGA